MDLLSEMAQSLGYKQLKQTEIDRFYEPQTFIDDRNNERLAMVETIKAMRFITNQKEEEQHERNIV